MNRSSLTVLTALALLASPLAAQPKAPTPPAPTAKPAPVKNVNIAPYAPLLAKVRSTLTSMSKGEDFTAGYATIDRLWQWTITYVPEKESAVYREVGLAARLTSQLKDYKGDKAKMLAFLLASPRLAANLSFLIVTESEKPADIYAVLDTLRAKFGDKPLELLPALTAAICVDYDRPIVEQLNENTVKGVSAVDAFDYYCRNDRSMVCSLSDTPPELLIYAVNPAAPTEDLYFALNRYSGQREIGPRYKEVPYDNDNFKRGKPKKINEHGVNLPNCLKYGGVCVDQAYFTATVGKAIGVPAVSVTGDSATVGHAWVGYLRLQGREAVWDFDTGRYDEYKDLRGDVTDPQTGSTIADGALAATAECMGLHEELRQASVAFVDAAQRFASIANAAKGETPPSITIDGLDIPTGAKPRPFTAAGRLALLKQAVNLHHTSARAWNNVKNMATRGELTMDQKKTWADALYGVSGTMYPDFTMAVMVPMVATIEDTREQARLWDWLFNAYRSKRPDLASQAYIAEGKMWDKASEPDKAWNCYQEVVNKYINDGPFALTALDLCERMLLKRKTEGAILGMYEDAFRRTKKPHDMASQFATGSNWYRVGSRYATLLEKDGQYNQAKAIRQRIEPKENQAGN